MIRRVMLCLVHALAAFAAAQAGARPATDHCSVVFYSGRGDNKDIHILDPGQQEFRRLTDHPAQDLCPAAAPDGSHIAFLSDRGGKSPTRASSGPTAGCRA